jgi:hypothetical protein
MECGETDFSSLLDDQRGKPLNMSFVALYWQQVSRAMYWLNGIPLTMINALYLISDARSRSSGTRAEGGSFGS